MNIGIVCYPTFGGSGVVATELGRGLAREGHKVHFITYMQPSRFDYLNENLFYHEVDIRTYPLFQYPPYELALASTMVNVIKYEKLDLLHVHYASCICGIYGQANIKDGKYTYPGHHDASWYGYHFGWKGGFF